MYGGATVSGAMTANQYLCDQQSTNWETLNTGVAGCFIRTNQWWYKGYASLNICITGRAWDGSVIGAWTGRAYLSGNGGVIAFYTDYISNLQISSVWDNSGFNLIRVYYSTLSSMTYKVYG